MELETIDRMNRFYEKVVSSHPTEKGVKDFLKPLKDTLKDLGVEEEKSRETSKNASDLLGKLKGFGKR